MFYKNKEISQNDEENNSINNNINHFELKIQKEKEIKKFYYLEFYIPISISIFILLILLFILIKIFLQNPIIINKRKLDNFKANETISENSTIKEQPEENEIKKDKFQEFYVKFSREVENSPEKRLQYFLPKEYGDTSFKISFNYSEAIHQQLIKKVNSTKIANMPKDKLKFGLCTIGKLENLNARDFVIYYLELGVDKIFIYDNNEFYGEKFEDVLSDFIDDEYVEIKSDVRGNQSINPQHYVYEKCYHEHREEFDWLLFFDFDEYLYIGKHSLNDFVQQSMFDKCDSIVFYLRQYTDNNELYYSNESPIKRFTEIIPDYIQKNKNFRFSNTKSISRGKIKELTYMKSIHAPFFLNGTYNTKHITCNSLGNTFIRFNESQENEITFKNAFIKHFQWRSTEEFCIKLAVRKFFKSYNWGAKDYGYLKMLYLKINERSKEKEEIMNKCMARLLG
jgi:hypothetical protein